MDPAKKYFSKDVSDRERAIFEGGISLGAIYHQFVGLPISKSTDFDNLEKTIENSIKTQPYIEDVKVKINRDFIKKDKSNEYNYHNLEGKMLDISLTANYNNTKVKMGCKYIKELDYPLMYVEE